MMRPILEGMSSQRSRNGSAEPTYRRLALAPALIAAIALGVGYPLVETDAYLYVRLVVAIMAVIVAVFAIQAHKWLWAIPMGIIAIVWNPMFPLTLEPVLWLTLQTIALVVLVTAGAVIKTPADPEG